MKTKYPWQEKHGEVISNFLLSLNNKSSDYVLKGGTSLMMCYNLDRFSEDIDLDGMHSSNSISKIVSDFCEHNSFTYRIAKDTDTVKRYMIDYGGLEKPLKIEVSFRRKANSFKPNEIAFINKIKVYSIDALCNMKASAYMNRDKIRDLYDVAFICNNYWDKLSDATKDVLRNSIEYKGIEQFDYIMKTQHDELIDTDKLTDDYLAMYDKLGLLFSEEEKEIVSNTNLNSLNKTVEVISAYHDTVQKKSEQILSADKCTDFNR